MHVTSALELAVHVGAFATDKKLLIATNHYSPLYYNHPRYIRHSLNIGQDVWPYISQLALGMQAWC